MKSRTPWFRFEAGYPTNPKTLRMSWEGVALFPLICCMFKAQGWPGETGEDDIDPAVLSRYTGMPLDVVEAGLREVFKVELMVREDGYAVIPAWRTFQPDPGVTERVRKHREKQNETVTKRDETVTTVGNADGTVPDGTVRYGTGQKDILSSSAKPKPDVMAQVREVFDHWKSTLNHPKTKLGSDRVIKIRSRLREGFTVEELKQAIDGCAASPHHMGDNDRGPDGNGKVFDSIGLIFAGSDSVDRFKGYMNTKPRKQDFKPTPGVYRNAQMDPAMKARIEAQKKAQREAGNDPS